jgi:hypothetical protein
LQVPDIFAKGREAKQSNYGQQTHNVSGQHSHTTKVEEHANTQELSEDQVRILLVLIALTILPTLVVITLMILIILMILLF